jgi:hypothetical protein
MTILDDYGAPILLGPDGERVTSAAIAEAPERCPKCDDDGSDRKVVHMMGRHWRLLCGCGYEFARGRGDAPLEGDEA